LARLRMFFTTCAVLACLLYCYGAAAAPYCARALQHLKKFILKTFLLVTIYLLPRLAQAVLKYRLYTASLKKAWLQRNVAYPAKRHNGEYSWALLPFTDLFYRLDRVAYRLRYADVSADRMHVNRITEYVVLGAERVTLLNTFMARSTASPLDVDTDRMHQDFLAAAVVLHKVLKEHDETNGWLQKTWAEMRRTKQYAMTLADDSEQYAVLIDVEYRQYNEQTCSVGLYRHLYVLTGDAEQTQTFPPVAYDAKQSKAIVWDASAGIDVTEDVRQYAGPCRDFAANTAQPMTIGHLKLALLLRHGAKLANSKLEFDIS
jgi:hypothetical protein